VPAWVVKIRLQVVFDRSVIFSANLQ